MLCSTPLFLLFQGSVEEIFLIIFPCYSEFYKVICSLKLYFSATLCYPSAKTENSGTLEIKLSDCHFLQPLRILIQFAVKGAVAKRLAVAH